RAGAIAFRKTKIVPHSNLVAITNDGSTGQGHHQAVGQFQPAAISLQHGRQPAANSTIVKLHLLLRTESSENRLALLLGKASEIEFIVIAQELAPLRGGRTRPGLLERDG